MTTRPWQEEARAFMELANALWTRKGYIYENQDRKTGKWTMHFDSCLPEEWRSEEADSWTGLLEKLNRQAEREYR